MSDHGAAGTPQPAPPGWYPDPWTSTRRRYWTGTSWTFATTGAVPIDHPAPDDATPLAEGHGLPAPVARVYATAAPATPAKRKQNPVKWALAVVVGLIVGVVGVVLSTGDDDPEPRAAPPSTVSGGSPTSAPIPVPTTLPGAPSTANNDPSTASLASLVVKPEDVPADVSVVVFTGGVGLSQPTLDLCNGRYPSEGRRTARLQDAVLDAGGKLVLSTEAVLYRDSAATTQAFAELRSVVAACPPTPVQSPVGQDPVASTFNAAPDGAWPQVASVNRLAFDVTIDDGSGRVRRTVAVYLRRGRALLGVYFNEPDGPLPAVEGQTTIQGIVNVFATRLAALPVSVVGA